MSLMVKNWDLGDKGFVIDFSSDKKPHALYNNESITIDGTKYNIASDDKYEYMRAILLEFLQMERLI